MAKFEVSDIHITPLRPRNGHCGFASAVINNQFYVGDIAIYSSPTSPDGFRLVFPTKKLANGKHVDFFYPINRDSQQQITKAIIRKYIDLMDNFHNVEA